MDFDEQKVRELIESLVINVLDGYSDSTGVLGNIEIEGKKIQFQLVATTNEDDFIGCD